jgi:hypothetical protein
MEGYAFFLFETGIGSAHLFVHLADGNYRVADPPRKSGGR